MQSQWPATITEWLSMARLAAEVCGPRGVPLGGAASLHAHICSAVYYDLFASSAQAAQTFAIRAGITPTMASAAKGNEEIDACEAAGITYTFHSYTNDASTLGQVIDYARARSGAEVWCNEIGFRTSADDVTTGPALAGQVAASTLPLALWYGSGQGPNAPSQLWLTDGTPTLAGQSVLAAT